MAKDNDLKTPNVPPLRFPGFSDEWMESTIGKVVKIGNGRDYKHLGNGSIPVFGTGGYMTSVDDYLYDGETVFIGRKGSIDKPFYFSGKFWTVDTLFYTHDFNEVMPKFLYSIFQRINWKKYNEASGVPSLSKATIEKIRVNYPSSAEQNKIAHLLLLIDERIATQNKIIDNLQSLIKGLRERIFAPMLSNLIKLGAIANITNGSGDVQDAISKYADDLYPFFDRSEDMKYFSSFGFDAEAIIYAGEGSEFLPRYYNGKFALHQRCYAITNFNKDYIPRFVYHFLSTQNNYFIRKAVGSTVPSLRMDTFQNIGIPIVDKTLQSYVSNRLDTSCRLYDYEKQILSLYRNQKDYLLQNLFI